jgi:hypothetical protein
MRSSESIVVAVSLLLIALSLIRPLGFARRSRIFVLGGAVVAAIAAARFGFSERVSPILRDWLPVVLLLIPYWQAGQFFESRNRRIEDWLLESDRRFYGFLARHGIEMPAHGWITILEFFYLMCYPLVPLGLAVLYLSHQRAAANFYWNVVVLATSFCFLATVFVPAMPPRFFEARSATRPRAGGVRGLNMAILNRASIHAITFPSAHVASVVSGALVLLRIAPLAGSFFAILALGVALGAFFGRYHYLWDVILGAIVAVTIFTCWIILGS